MALATFLRRNIVVGTEEKSVDSKPKIFDIKKSLNPRSLPDIATSKWNGREKRPYQIDILKKLLFPKLTKLCSDCTLVLFKPCFPCCSAAVFIRKKTKTLNLSVQHFFVFK